MSSVLQTARQERRTLGSFCCSTSCWSSPWPSRCCAGRSSPTRPSGARKLSATPSSISPGSGPPPRSGSVAHLRIDVMIQLHRLEPHAKTALYILGDLVMLAMVALIAVYWSWETVLVSWKFGSVSHGLRVSHGLVPDGRAARLRPDDLPSRAIALSAISRDLK